MKVELHLHTGESSHCGKVCAEDALKVYKEKGYDAVVITDHFARYVFDRRQPACDREKIDSYLLGYRKAREAGEKLGLQVFLGTEMRFDASNANDYLVYGLDEAFFYEHPDVDQWRFSEFLKRKPENCLVYQAHPFRNGMTVTDPARLFGIEVFNGHSGHDSRNAVALAWARMHHLHAISGSDAHHPHTLCAGGILTDRDVFSMADLIEVLKEDAYALINRNVLDPLHW